MYIKTPHEKLKLSVNNKTMEGLADLIADSISEYNN